MLRVEALPGKIGSTLCARSIRRSRDGITSGFAFQPGSWFRPSRKHLRAKPPESVAKSVVKGAAVETILSKENPRRSRHNSLSTYRLVHFFFQASKPE